MKVRGYGDETCSSKITQVSEMGAFDTLVRREPYQPQGDPGTQKTSLQGHFFTNKTEIFQKCQSCV